MSHEIIHTDKAPAAVGPYVQAMRAGNLLFASLGSSALCYLIWGRATELVGAVTTSVYLYLLPVVSVIGAAVILGEPVDMVTVAAIAVILIGLVFSQKGNEPA